MNRESFAWTIAAVLFSAFIAIIVLIVGVQIERIIHIDDRMYELEKQIIQQQPLSEPEE